jgi:Cu(I)/Ag(I) efflux system membrane fusion protein
MKRIILVILICSIQSSLASKDLQSQDEYKWQKVQRGGEVTTFPVTGQVKAEEGALHFQTARVSGRVLSLVNEEGSSVKKGDPLFRITGPECVSIREERRIALKSNLEDLVLAIEQRQKELNIIVSDNECIMVSDSEGVLVKRNLGSGSAFNQGDALAQILEPSKMIIEIEVPEKSAPVISRGTVVNFKIPSLNNFKGKSVVQQVFPLVDEGTRIMKARLKKVHLPVGTKLNSMVFANVSLSSGKECLVVSSTAVTLQDSNSWVIKKSDKLEKIPVVVISNGVDKLMINPAKEGTLNDGDIVATKNVPFLFQELKKNESKN